MSLEKPSLCSRTASKGKRYLWSYRRLHLQNLSIRWNKSAFLDSVCAILPKNLKNMYPEHLINTINCSFSVQSKLATTSRVQLPSFVIAKYLSDYLAALKKIKPGARLKAVGEVIRRLDGECIAKEPAFKPWNLFGAKHLEIHVKREPRA